MKLNVNECQRILDTLPIGYYAGRKIPVELNKTEPTSYYSPMEDKIVVSYPIIAERLEAVKEDSNTEEAVRSMLYHEVSHAILTPSSLSEYACDDAVNIVEDERIETIFSDYYMNVDFEKQLYDITGGPKNPPSNKLEEFFNLIRFGVGSPKLIEKRNKLLSDYKHLNRRSNKYDSYSYKRAIDKLYQELEEEEKDNKEENANSDGENTDNSEESNGDNNKQSISVENNETEVNKCDLHLSREEIQAMCKDSVELFDTHDEEEIKELEDFRKTVTAIIDNFNKKNKSGSGIGGYSGVFNPRMVTRQDYKYFERAMNIQGNNQFGTCHLNLFIDCSGSFCYNETRINSIIAILSDIERHNKNFTMDLSFINHKYKDCITMKDREFRAGGGNAIPKDMKQRFLARQKNGTCNYNIVLFDGDAFSDDFVSFSEKIAKFSAFDYKQTCLITDSDNKKYLGRGFKNTKVIVTEKYTDELIKNITKALSMAFH